MADTVLTQGTIEFVWVDVTDLLAQLPDLSGTSPTCDVVRVLGNVVVLSAHPADNVVGMRAYFLLDTSNDPTAGGIPWAAGDYKLYTSFTVGVEQPRVGPLHFTVDAS